jgi:hypothetical protein
MPETTAPDTSPPHARPRPSANGTAPPVPPEATKARMRMWLGAVDRFRIAMTPLRRMMRRTARRA